MSVQAQTHRSPSTADVRRLPNPDEPIPTLAGPTVVLFVLALSIFAGSTALAVAGPVPYAVAAAVNAVASYMFFTVLHDASHRSISQRDAVNTWFGRLSAPMVTPFASYSVFRFIHMQHHRFTNDDQGRDPDAYTSNGPRWSWPLRWMTLDLSYLVYYFPRFGERPRKERIEFVITTVLVVSAATLFTVVAGFWALVALYVIPTRLNVLFLGFAFDWLPHHGLEETQESNRYRATRNRVGFEWMMAPVLLYQNYHLVHHLHPLIPFYRYIAAWRKNEDAYLERDPALSTVGGRELDADEYRRLRGLDA